MRQNKHNSFLKILLGGQCMFGITPHSHPSLDLGHFTKAIMFALLKCLSFTEFHLLAYKSQHLFVLDQRIIFDRGSAMQP